jgi:hypothetical protein
MSYSSLRSLRTAKIAAAPRAKKSPILHALAPLTRFAEVMGLSGALQRLQRGSRPELTSRSIQ